MSLNLSLLEKPRVRAGKLISRCPACAEHGADKSCEHLFISDEGRGAFACIAFSGPAGGDHRKRIWELAGKLDRPDKAQAVSVLLRPRRMPADQPARLPELRPLTPCEMATVCRQRGWPTFAGLELLTRRGLLWHGLVWDDNGQWPAWIITDQERHNAQARRLDGVPWAGIGGKKAKSLPGSQSAWPIGIKEVGSRPVIVLCEGQPDFCAALSVAWLGGANADEIAPVCMTGAGSPIANEALPYFKGRHVRITAHVDSAGHQAGCRWAKQLYEAGATMVDRYDFTGLLKHDGTPVKDLSDFLATQADEEARPSGSVFSRSA